MIVGRWVLLLCTVFGLATMHTLGHSGVHREAHGHGELPAVVAAASGVWSGHGAEDAPCDHGRCPGHGDGTAWSVCLAVLSGLAVLVLLATVIVRRRRGGVRRALTAVARTPRAPPPRRRQGLRVVSLTVLRI